MKRSMKDRAHAALDSIVAMAQKAHAADALGAYERGYLRGGLLTIQEHMDPDADKFDAALATVHALSTAAAGTEHTTAAVRFES